MALVIVDGMNLTIEETVAVAREQTGVRVSRRTLQRSESSREAVERAIAEGRTIYGVTTGFGALADRPIRPSEIRTLQKNIILSHQTAVGQPLPEDAVRASMLIRLNSLARGNSGVRPEIIRMLVDMLNHRVHPVIPEQGSVGASGDLSQLAHMAAVMIGLGQAAFKGGVFGGAEALEKAGLVPLTLEAKEGLALTNGTSVSAGIAVLALWDSERLIETAEVAGAMSVEALEGMSEPFEEEIHTARSYRGQIVTASNIRKLIGGSSLIDSDAKRVQDAYSLRCIPQVYGAIREALAFVRSLLHVEINSATDNPLIFPDRDLFLSGGNFHGHTVALTMDQLSSSMASLGNICERRIFRLLSEHLSGGLPAFLVKKTGLNTGYMMLQYTAASLASENKILAQPASVDTIPTSADQEDFNSMSLIAATKASKIARNVEKIVAIELLCAAQALDLREPLKPGLGTGEAKAVVRSRVPFLEEDRDLGEDLRLMFELVRSGEILRQVGPLLK
ncbi:MAG: histidine ammonia-lyase [Candidatus Geothermarchaeales archaeon]